MLIILFVSFVILLLIGAPIGLFLAACADTQRQHVPAGGRGAADVQHAEQLFASCYPVFHSRR